MERCTDNIADVYGLPSHPEESDTLEEAMRLDEEALGYPLNLMFSLYYETTFGDSSRNTVKKSQRTPEESHE